MPETEATTGNSMATKFLEPPSFVNEKKSYRSYKNDLQQWARITSVEKKLQAEIVVYGLKGHYSQIKEKIGPKIGK